MSLETKLSKYTKDVFGSDFRITKIIFAIVKITSLFIHHV